MVLLAPSWRALLYLINELASYADNTDMKTAVVVPAYKKGSSSDPANYRPISQTSVFCKLMERVIVGEMSNYLFSIGAISKHQHGFVAKRSTTTNLLETLNDWTLSIDNCLKQTVVYVDFARAFDSVPPNSK